MICKFKKAIGSTDFHFEVEIKTHEHLFKAVSFVQDIPSVGPGGQTDLRLVHRSTSEGYDYFSVVSEEAGEEFKFGQTNDDSGKLFPKDWVALYNAGQNKTPKPATSAASTTTAKPKATKAKKQKAAAPVETTEQEAEDIVNQYL